MNIEVKIYFKIEELPSLPAEQYNACVDSLSLYEGIPYYKPFLLIAFSEEKPVASLFSYIMRINRFFGGSFFKRCYINQAPSFFEENTDKEEIFKNLITEWYSFVKSRAFYLEVSNLESTTLGYGVFRKLHFISTKKINIKTQINQETPVWNKLSLRKRAQVLKSRRLGLTIDELSTDEELRILYNYFEKYNNWKFVHQLPPYKYFENFYHQMTVKNKGKIFLTVYKNKIIGGNIVSIKGDTITNLFDWSHSKRYSKLHPSTFSVWNLIEYGEKNGYKTIDFLESGHFNQKTGRVKKLINMGGIEKATRRWYRFNWNVINYFMSKMYND